MLKLWFPSSAAPLSSLKQLGLSLTSPLERQHRLRLWLIPVSWPHILSSPTLSVFVYRLQSTKLGNVFFLFCFLNPVIYFFIFIYFFN